MQIVKSLLLIKFLASRQEIASKSPTKLICNVSGYFERRNPIAYNFIFMKTRKMNQFRSALLFVCLFMISCSKDLDNNKDIGIHIGNIYKIESLGNISLGQSDTILISFSGGSNGCFHADHLEVNTLGTTILFKAYYNYPVEPQMCPQNAPTFSITYIFTPSLIGTYRYKSFNTEAESSTEVK